MSPWKKMWVHKPIDTVYILLEIFSKPSQAQDSIVSKRDKHMQLFRFSLGLASDLLCGSAAWSFAEARSFATMAAEAFRYWKLPSSRATTTMLQLRLMLKIVNHEAPKRIASVTPKMTSGTSSTSLKITSKGFRSPMRMSAWCGSSLLAKSIL